jgi:hypothetical protein
MKNKPPERDARRPKKSKKRMGGTLAAPAVHGPNRPWDDDGDGGVSPVPPTGPQLAEFYAFVRPLTALDHEVAGRAALLPDVGDGAGDAPLRLRPTFMVSGEANRIDPDLGDAVSGGRGDCYFHTHPASYANAYLGPHADCWPSAPDLVHSLGVLAACPELYADLVVARCALVVVGRTADFWDAIDADSTESITRAQYAVVRALMRHWDDTDGAPVDPAELRRLLLPRHLSVRWIPAPGVDVAAAPPSRTALFTDPEWFAGFHRHMAECGWLDDADADADDGD